MLPVKLLEYVHLGIPGDCSAAAGHPILLREDQVAYYEPGDVDELAECIRRSMRTPWSGPELARKSAEFAKEIPLGRAQRGIVSE